MPNASGTVVTRTILLLDCHVQHTPLVARPVHISLKAKTLKNGTTQEGQEHVIPKPVLAACTQAFLEYCRILFDLYPEDTVYEPPEQPVAGTDSGASAKAAGASGAAVAGRAQSAGAGKEANQLEPPKVFVLPRDPDPAQPSEGQEGIFIDIWDAIPRDTKGMLQWMADRCTPAPAPHLHRSLDFAVKNLTMARPEDDNGHRATSGRIVVVVQPEVRVEASGGDAAWTYEEKKIMTSVEVSVRACYKAASAQGLDFTLNTLEVTVLRLVPSESPLAATFLPLETSTMTVGEGAGQRSVTILAQAHWVKLEALAAVMQDLACLHLWLRTIRVTGIPMKEGDNSARTEYDVVLLHKSDDHVSAGSYAASLPLGSGLCLQRNERRLQWKTTEKKLNTGTLAADCIHRLTPLDLSSSPSQCLVKYLMSKKPVTLAVDGASEAGLKYSHLLLQQGGDIYLHCLRGTVPLAEHVPDRILDFYQRPLDTNMRTEQFVNLIHINMLYRAGNVRLPLAVCPTTLHANPIELDLASLPTAEQKPEGASVGRGQVLTAPGILRQTMLFPYYRTSTILCQVSASPRLARLLGVLRTYLENPNTADTSVVACVEVVHQLFRASQVNDGSLFPNQNPSWRKECYDVMWGEVMLLAYRSALVYPSSSRSILETIQSLFKGQTDNKGKNNNVPNINVPPAEAMVLQNKPGGKLLPQKRPVGGSDAHSWQEFGKNRKQMKLGTYNHTDITHQGTTLEEERKGQKAGLVDQGRRRDRAGNQEAGSSLFSIYWAGLNKAPTKTQNVL